MGRGADEIAKWGAGGQGQSCVPRSTSNSAESTFEKLTPRHRPSASVSQSADRNRTCLVPFGGNVLCS